ncbi:helix-turn-helix transcriptional regulator [Arthrobacter sp. A2-55]|uniref:helix-turn-helix transcriptional regulator n=1 Tax=Arthrobacter sp. A2-55 TaxID=2897337 RepID=UPI0021CD19B3|nr:helix-turn-helix transcriptional regulator [Arthrobacter sp. A2-55]
MSQSTHAVVQFTGGIQSPGAHQLQKANTDVRADRRKKKLGGKRQAPDSEPAADKPFETKAFPQPSSAPPSKNAAPTISATLQSAVALDALMHDAGWLGAVVTGPGGVGKTALIHQVLAGLPDGTAFQYLRGTPFASRVPFGMLSLLMGPASPLDPSRAGGPAGTPAGSQYGTPSEAPYGTPTEAPYGNPPTIPSTTPGSPLLGVVMQALRANLTDGCVVAVDNADNADSWSALALSELAANGDIRLVLGCRRVDALPQEFSRLWRDGRLLRLDVSALDAAETRNFVQSELAGPCSLAVTSLLWRESCGNPFQLKALLHQGVADGAFLRTHGIWVWNGPAAASGTAFNTAVNTAFNSAFTADFETHPAGAAVVPQAAPQAAQQAAPQAARLVNATNGSREILDLVGQAGSIPVSTLLERFPAEEVDALFESGDLRFAGGGRQLLTVAHPALARVLQQASPDRVLPAEVAASPGWVSDTVAGALPADLAACLPEEAVLAGRRAESLSLAGHQDDALQVAAALGTALGTGVGPGLVGSLMRVYVAGGEWRRLDELMADCLQQGVVAGGAECAAIEVAHGLIQAFRGHYDQALELLDRGAAQLSRTPEQGWEAVARIAVSHCLAMMGGTSAAGRASAADRAASTTRGPSTAMAGADTAPGSPDGVVALLNAVHASPAVPALYRTLAQCLAAQTASKTAPTATTNAAPTTSQILDTWPEDDLPLQRMLTLLTKLRTQSSKDTTKARGKEDCTALHHAAAEQQGPLAEAVGVYAKGLLSQDSEVLVQAVELASRMDFPALALAAARQALALAPATSVRGVRHQLQRLVELPPELAGTRLRTRLTGREAAMAALAAAGASNRDIAESVGVSVRTVEGHLYQAYAKLHVTNREELGPLLDLVGG